MRSSDDTANDAVLGSREVKAHELKNQAGQTSGFLLRVILVEFTLVSTSNVTRVHVGATIVFNLSHKGV